MRPCDGFLTLLILLAAAGAATPASEEPFGQRPQSLESVRSAAEAAVRALAPQASGLRVESARLDSRLRLPTCARPLKAETAASHQSTASATVVVSCDAPLEWRLTVPVRISSETDVLVLTRPLPRGAVVSAADVTVQSRRVPGFAGGFASRVADLDTRTLRRPLAAGSAIPLDALAAAAAIRRGQAVTLLARANGFEIRAPGLALADARRGQRVRVQNSASLKIVEGVADEQSLVRIEP